MVPSNLAVRMVVAGWLLWLMLWLWLLVAVCVACCVSLPLMSRVCQNFVLHPRSSQTTDNITYDSIWPSCTFKPSLSYLMVLLDSACDKQ